MQREIVKVALRKESVDRNQGVHYDNYNLHWSLSARRAWIEIMGRYEEPFRSRKVALRKESVDRNLSSIRRCLMSAVALRKESVDRNLWWGVRKAVGSRRSPQGERG